MDHLSNELAKTDFKDSFLFYSYKPSAKLVKPVYIPRFFQRTAHINVFLTFTLIDKIDSHMLIALLVLLRVAYTPNIK